MQKPCIYYYWWNKCKHNTRLSLSDITITEMMGSPVNTFLRPAVLAVAVSSGPGSLPQYRPPVLPPNLVHSQLPFLCSEYPAQWHRQHFIIFYSILFYSFIYLTTNANFLSVSVSLSFCLSHTIKLKHLNYR